MEENKKITPEAKDLLVRYLDAYINGSISAEQYQYCVKDVTTPKKEFRELVCEVFDLDGAHCNDDQIIKALTDKRDQLQQDSQSSLLAFKKQVALFTHYEALREFHAMCLLSPTEKESLKSYQDDTRSFDRHFVRLLAYINRVTEEAAKVDRVPSSI